MPFSTLRPCNFPVRVCWVDCAVQSFLEVFMEKTCCATSYTRMTGPLIWSIFSWFAGGCLWGGMSVKTSALPSVPNALKLGQLFSSFSGTRNTRSFAESHSLLHQNLTMGTKTEFCPCCCLVQIYLILNPFFPSLYQGCEVIPKSYP